MKLYRYYTLESLNEALKEFQNKGVRIAKVKLLTLGKKEIFYILTDNNLTYQK